MRNGVHILVLTGVFPRKSVYRILKAFVATWFGIVAMIPIWFLLSDIF